MVAEGKAILVALNAACRLGEAAARIRHDDAHSKLAKMGRQAAVPAAEDEHVLERSFDHAQPVEQLLGSRRWR